MQIKKTVKTLSRMIRRLKKLKIVVPLKHLSIPLINCEVCFTLIWSESCVLTDIISQATNPNADPAIPAINAPKNATF